MGRIRPLAPEDIPQVAALRRRVFRVTRLASPGALEDALERVFFRNPWYDPEMPSLVHEDAAGRVSGFLGMVPRRMVLHGRPLRAGTTTQLMVAPESRGVAGVRLVQAVFAGPQDLLMADVPNHAAQRIWEGLGGRTAPIYAFAWSRSLRPARAAAIRLGSGLAARGARRAARPLLNALDTCASRLPGTRFRPERPAGTVEPLSAEAMASGLSTVAGRDTLYPEYDGSSLGWLLEQVERKWPESRPEGGVVYDSGGKVDGWFLYLLNGGGEGEVLQLVARRKRGSEVLAHLFHHAWRSGAVTVGGRLPPGLLHDLSARSCAFRLRGRGVLVHSRDPEVTGAVLRGDALLGGLEGEWWMEF